jgi:hypothetical protein
MSPVISDDHINFSIFTILCHECQINLQMITDEKTAVCEIQIASNVCQAHENSFIIYTEH